MSISILHFTTKEDEVLCKAAEEKARQVAKYAGLDFDSLSQKEKNERAVTQFNRMMKSKK